jgi:hypothetical protein
VADGRLRVEVLDGGATVPPQPVPPPLESESGRGLLLVEALADRWGAAVTAEGKTLWFELAAVAAPPADPAHSAGRGAAEPS